MVTETAHTLLAVADTLTRNHWLTPQAWLADACDERACRLAAAVRAGAETVVLVEHSGAFTRARDAFLLAEKREEERIDRWSVAAHRARQASRDHTRAAIAALETTTDKGPRP